MTARAKNLLILSLTLAMFLAAIEGTIVTLAIPTIVADLQGFDLISWVFSVYLLAGAIATPVFGKLCDLFGRKRILIIGILIFIVGSACCGLSLNMFALIAFRFLQGIGSGAIFTVPFTIVGDVFPLKERGKVQGAMVLVWGIAGLVGPFLGGTLISLLSWHWLFFINVPVGLISVIVLQRTFQEQFHRVKQPIIPHGVFSRFSNVVNLIAFIIAAALIGIDVYLPIYLQSVLGLSPLLAGLMLLPMSLSWLVASVISGRVILRFGSKAAINGFLLLALLLSLPILFFDRSASLVLVGLTILLMGFGIGGAFATTTMAIQDSVGYEKRGTAVSLNSLLKSLGQTIGIGGLGVAFNAALLQGFIGAGIVCYNLANLYDLSSYQSGVSWTQVVDVLSSSMQLLFLMVIVMLAAALASGLLIPKQQRKTSGTSGDAAEGAANQTDGSDGYADNGGSG
ncbi:MAG: MFS transporter [Actinomycetia bacterium]|nr:MFS transporter [Actinomycetes bacterium]